MSAYRVKVVGLPHEQATLDRMRRYATDLMGDGWAERRAQTIAALPTVTWKGHTLYTLRCAGDFGRGPHDVNVPAYILWALIDPRHYRCAFHA